MAGAALVLFGVPLLLLVVGAWSTAASVSALRCRAVPRAVGILRIIGGVGVAVSPLITVVGLTLDVQYGVVLFPVAGLVLALIWGAGFFGSAAITDLVLRRRSPPTTCRG